VCGLLLSRIVFVRIHSFVMNLEALLQEQERKEKEEEFGPAATVGLGPSRHARPSACAKCGYSGHLTYQCRNFIPTHPNKV